MNKNIKKYKICVATTVHRAYDTRIFFKQIHSISKYYIVDYYSKISNCSNPITSGKFIPLPNSNSKFNRVIRNYVIFKLLCNSNYHLYHFHDPEMLLLGIFLKLRGKCVLFDMHEDNGKQIKNKEWIPPVLRGVFAYIFEIAESFVLKYFDCVILAEDSYVEKFRNHKNIKVIHNYPYQQKVHKTDYHFSSFKMVYLGDIRKVRGVMEYLKILNVGKSNKLNLKLALIGSFAVSEIEKEFKDYIKKNNLDNDIIFYGRLLNNEVYDILRKCDLGLSILHPVDNYIQSYPTKVFEYMSVGLPVLASNFELYKKIIVDNDCGCTIDPFDIIGAFNIVEKYYNNIELLKKHGQNGANLVKSKFNWESEEKMLLKVYDNLFINQSIK